MTDDPQRIGVPGARSLCWSGDTLVDWVAGGRVLHLDGTIEESRVHYAFPFDSAVTSPCGEFAVIYQNLGTKGLVLRNGKVVREINRSFYHADVYEYPIAIFRSSNAQVLLAHCPNEYCRLELEDIVTGERVGDSTNRKPEDFFHSRLRVSPNGRWLLSAGWVWHPWSAVSIFDLEAARESSAALDRTLWRVPVDDEVAAADFLPNDRMLIATHEERSDPDDRAGEWVAVSNALVVVDVATRQVISQSATAERVGSLMPIDEDVAVGFFEHPKLFSLRTGAVLKTWDTIKSGKQSSSIVWHQAPIPPIAVDVAHRRFAVAGEQCVYVVQL